MIVLSLDHTCPTCRGLSRCNRCDSTGTLVDNCAVCSASLGDDCNAALGDTYDGWTVDGVKVCDGCVPVALKLAVDGKARAA